MPPKPDPRSPVDPPLPVGAEPMDPPEICRPRRISSIGSVAINGAVITGIGIVGGVLLVPLALPVCGARTSVRLERQIRLGQIAAIEAEEAAEETP